MSPVYVVAVNIRSAYNIGALFRTADALGVAKILLAGYCPTPAHPEVKKTALGAETTVAWEHYTDAMACLERLRHEGMRLVALEIGAGGTELSAYHPSFPTALVIGNEVGGLTSLQLDMCDDRVYIQQQGMKESLNVTIAAAIAMYVLRPPDHVRA
jgi:23S rRNA (guanosine2251-2'-O)-methyltransferase